MASQRREPLKIRGETNPHQNGILDICIEFHLLKKRLSLVVGPPVSEQDDRRDPGGTTHLRTQTELDRTQQGTEALPPASQALAPSRFLFTKQKFAQHALALFLGTLLK